MLTPSMQLSPTAHYTAYCFDITDIIKTLRGTLFDDCEGKQARTIHLAINIKMFSWFYHFWCIVRELGPIPNLVKSKRP